MERESGASPVTQSPRVGVGVDLRLGARVQCDSQAPCAESPEQQCGTEPKGIPGATAAQPRETGLFSSS